MATYKVLQDIEAEDKLLGPLTLKQFIFAGIALACAYICFTLIVRGLGLLAIFFVPPMLATGFLAWPWSREQPTEIWLLAKLRFHIKPRKRIWNQSGINDLVRVTAPVMEEKAYTDGLSEGEVKSRLKALASTIDSRGWAIKNVNVNLSGEPAYRMASSPDRLIGLSSLPQEVVNDDVSAADDILDEDNNPTAQNLARMISATAISHKQRLVNRMKRSEAKAPDQQAQQDYWFLNQTSGPIPDGKAVFDSGVTVRPDESPQTPAPAPVAQSPGAAAYGNMHTIQPLGDPGAAAQPAPMTSNPVKPSGKTLDPAILKLASNDDLNVATIARQANKNKATGLEDGEVVIPLR